MFLLFIRTPEKNKIQRIVLIQCDYDMYVLICKYKILLLYNHCQGQITDICHINNASQVGMLNLKVISFTG